MLLTPTGFFYGSKLSQLELVDKTYTQASGSSTAPNSIEAGDLIIFFDLRNSSQDGNNDRIPSGFSLIYARNQSFKGTTDTFTTRMQISQKIAVGNEGGMTLSGIDNGSKTCVVLRGNHAIKTSTPSGWQGTGASTAGTSSLTTNVSDTDHPCIIVAARAWHINGGSISTSPTPDLLYSDNFYQRNSINIQLLKSSQADVTTSVTSSSGTFSGRHVVAGKLLLGIK